MMGKAEMAGNAQMEEVLRELKESNKLQRGGFYQTFKRMRSWGWVCLGILVILVMMAL